MVEGVIKMLSGTAHGTAATHGNTQSIRAGTAIVTLVIKGRLSSKTMKNLENYEKLSTVSLVKYCRKSRLRS